MLMTWKTSTVLSVLSKETLPWFRSDAYRLLDSLYIQSFHVTSGSSGNFILRMPPTRVESSLNTTFGHRLVSCSNTAFEMNRMANLH